MKGSVYIYIYTYVCVYVCGCKCVRKNDNSMENPIDVFHYIIFSSYCWISFQTLPTHRHPLTHTPFNYTSNILAPLAGAVEYTDCFPAEEYPTPLTSALDMMLNNLMQRFQ